MTRAGAPHRSTWLCPDAAARERLLDMDDRLKKPRAAAFAVLGLAVLTTVPTSGVWTVALLVVALTGFGIVERIRPRLAAPEHAIVASWAFAQALIAVAVGLTGGLESHAMSWLLVPLITLPARFGVRGVAAGVAFTTLLMVIVVVAVGIAPPDDAPTYAEAIFPIAALLAMALLSLALLQSDVDHRTESVIDGLTGMLNRRALSHRLDELQAQSRLTGEPVAVITGDLDRFKQVNDRHGHATGDTVLIDVAYRIRKRLRAFDLAYRLGGEEFLVVLPGATVDEAAAIAEDLRAGVAAEPMGSVEVTMSFGVAGSGAGGFDPELVLAEADAALYAAKAAGRDRVVTAAAAPRRPVPA